MMGIELKAAEILDLIDHPTNTHIGVGLRKGVKVIELVKALRTSTTSHQRAVLCNILRIKRAKSAVPAIIECLQDPSANTRSEAAQALGEIGNPIAGKPLFDQFLLEHDIGVKSAFVVALGGVKYTPAIPALITTLKHPDFRMREMAAWSLGYMHAVEALPDLQAISIIESETFAKARFKEAIDRLST